MAPSPQTIIIRHRRERLSKCSLRGLEGRPDLNFVTFPHDPPPSLAGHLYLSLNGPPLVPADTERPLCLVDATWRLARRVENAWAGHLQQAEPRTLPAGLTTAYPRQQTACPDPQRGLASIEALYVARFILGQPVNHLLDGY
ncbi:MAG: hypothetical protein OER86_14005, partial [Phycisphaerae bacterium]|nr:hypothetical protein [Phycisphaerae bacterium]